MTERDADRARGAITVRPATPELWPALENLFADSPVCGRCWCMYPRIGGRYRRRPASTNRAGLRRIVHGGPPPGLLAFDGDLPVGWCQVTPRDAVPAFDRMWRLRRVDDLQVWSLSCFYVRKDHRRRGISRRLVAEAVEAARRAGAPALEAYPVDRSLTPSATSTGVLSTFLQMGFVEVGRHVPPRPIVRCDFGADAAGGSG